MKKKILCLTAFFCALQIHAQQWQPDWETSLEIAQRDNKKILLVFSGSDWCIPCIRLENEVWNSSDFQDYSSNHLVMYRADFPKRKKNQLPPALQKINEQLANDYNPKGYFPWVVVFDSEQNLKGTFAYDKKPVSAYIEQIQSF